MYQFLDPSQWFSFERRCLVCSARIDTLETNGPHSHLDKHVVEEIMLKIGKTYAQIKPHPLGFPQPV